MFHDEPHCQRDNAGVGECTQQHQCVREFVRLRTRQLSMEVSDTLRGEETNQPTEGSRLAIHEIHLGLIRACNECSRQRSAFLITKSCRRDSNEPLRMVTAEIPSYRVVHFCKIRNGVEPAVDRRITEEGELFEAVDGLVVQFISREEFTVGAHLEADTTRYSQQDRQREFIEQLLSDVLWKVDRFTEHTQGLCL